MRVWRWGYESDKFETITFPLMSEVFAQYFDPYFNGLPLNDKWGEVQVETYQKRKPADCTGIGNNIPIFGERAAQVLDTLLADQAELLPLQHPDKTLYAINVIRVVDALDHERSEIEWLAGRPLAKKIHKYVFKPQALEGCTIFKIPERKSLRVFVTDAFKEAVEANKLKGFSFELLWDSEADGSAEVELERKYQEALAAVERSKGEEFPFSEAERRVEAGRAVASGKWRLQQAEDGSMQLGNLQADGSYNWIQPLFYPPVLLDLKWHEVEVLSTH